MRVFKLTQLGARTVRHEDGKATDSEDFRILQYVGDKKDATLSEIEVIGDRWRVEQLKSKGLLEELTA